MFITIWKTFAHVCHVKCIGNSKGRLVGSQSQQIMCVQTIHAGEGVARKERLYAVGANVSWYITMENSMEGP